MSVATIILGESGTGKSTSLRHLDPAKTLLVQAIKKPLPFKSAGWKIKASSKADGNIIQTDGAATIEKVLRNSAHPVIVIDDYQAVLVNELMNRSAERGYDKFTDIAKGAWTIFNTANALEERRRVYIMAHTQTDEVGYVRMKTVGKMVDQVIVPESFFTIVLRTQVRDGIHMFSTQSNGQDCCKSPIGMFSEREIPNDLAEVDNSICAFYGIEQ